MDNIIKIKDHNPKHHFQDSLFNPDEFRDNVLAPAIERSLESGQSLIIDLEDTQFYRKRWFKIVFEPLAKKYWDKGFSSLVVFKCEGDEVFADDIVNIIAKLLIHDIDFKKIYSFQSIYDGLFNELGIIRQGNFFYVYRKTKDTLEWKLVELFAKYGGEFQIEFLHKGMLWLNLYEILSNIGLENMAFYYRELVEAEMLRNMLMSSDDLSFNFSEYQQPQQFIQYAKKYVKYI
jgi:hypothetical protein